jgi:leader peptidase (prepilin peptidase) / N-methyltransferase
MGTMNEHMEIYLMVIFGLMGASIGSFINVVADRLPDGRSLIAPPSHCDDCQRQLTGLDLIPIFSYIVLRGRCRYCGVKIPLRVLWVELGTGLFTAFLFWYKGLTLEFGIIALYSYIYLAIALIDMQHKLILNKIVYPSLVVALAISPFFIKTGFPQAGVAEHGIVNALIGAATGFIFLLIPNILSRGGMGMGDVKMAALIGLTTGFGEVLVAVLGGIILGGLVAIFLLATGIKKRKEVMPFGPFLSIAAVVTLLWGTPILNWYMGFFTR